MLRSFHSLPMRAAFVLLLGTTVLTSCSREAPESEPGAIATPAGAEEGTRCKRIAESEQTTVTTESGLMYADTKRCAGTTVAQNGATVSVHYTGYLYDENADFGRGSQFDSSVERGDPFVFTLGRGQVIRGWDEGLLGMTAGSKRRLTIPHELAYGVRGRPPVIPPSATLVFAVELLNAEDLAEQ